MASSNSAGNAGEDQDKKDSKIWPHVVNTDFVLAVLHQKDPLMRAADWASITEVFNKQYPSKTTQSLKLHWAKLRSTWLEEFMDGATPPPRGRPKRSAPATAGNEDENNEGEGEGQAEDFAAPNSKNIKKMKTQPKVISDHEADGHENVHENVHENTKDTSSETFYETSSENDVSHVTDDVKPKDI
ncbi:hypothetical protein TruAng_000093 [Truncatella angustata]|nr:hypothetical protein TruAng_000093 [Truncatella angustata]